MTTMVSTLFCSARVVAAAATGAVARSFWVQLQSAPATVKARRSDARARNRERCVMPASIKCGVAFGANARDATLPARFQARNPYPRLIRASRDSLRAALDLDR